MTHIFCGCKARKMVDEMNNHVHEHFINWYTRKWSLFFYSESFACRVNFLFLSFFHSFLHPATVVYLAHLGNGYILLLRIVSISWWACLRWWTKFKWAIKKIANEKKHTRIRIVDMLIRLNDWCVGDRFESNATVESFWKCYSISQANWTTN